MISVIDNRKAFNIICGDSLLIFQFSNHLVPCAAQVEVIGDLNDAVRIAYETIMDQYPPDDSKTALIMDNSSSPHAEQVATYLMCEGYCSKCFIVPDEVSFLAKYSFLVNTVTTDFPIYASEITDNLYLGGISCLEERVLFLQG